MQLKRRLVRRWRLLNNKPIAGDTEQGRRLADAVRDIQDNKRAWADATRDYADAEAEGDVEAMDAALNRKQELLDERDVLEERLQQIKRARGEI